MIDVAVGSRDDLPGIAELYSEADYGAPIRTGDVLIVAKSGGRVMGVVRLCREEGVSVLRGMQVRSTFQRQGIGARLLLACLPQMAGGPVYCLPYTHLVDFYAGAGFAAISADELPAFFAQRLATYLTQGQKVLAMVLRKEGPAT